MAKTRSKSFWSKYQERFIRTKSLVCVGLDSDINKLPDCVRQSTNPIWEFNQQIIDATWQDVNTYKPNLAFYLADGVRGLEALYQTIEYIPDEIPVIIDCKVGDIGSTMEGYIAAFWKSLNTDAITVNPLMGKDVLSPILKIEDTFAFVLTLTSNPSAQDFFKNYNLDIAISEWLSDYPKDRIGCVVGATQTSDLEKVRKLNPNRVFLIPGIGAQGGDLEAVMRFAITSPTEPNILINSSRGIIFKDSSNNFAKIAAQETAKLRKQIIDLL